MSDTFFLQPHIFLSRAKRHWVILDVNRDKYLCVDRHQFESLGPWLHGWDGTVSGIGKDASVNVASAAVAGGDNAASAPTESATRSVGPPTASPDGRGAAPALPRNAIALANRLLSLEILSANADRAKDARAIAYPTATDALDPDLPVRARRSPYTHALAFFLSSATASRQLRDKGFQATIARVRARKRRHSGATNPFDFERARSLISVFGNLRWFYPRPYLCLFDSLALIEFLAHFGLYPDWVFGVTADPFEAHCWVQSGGVVLNDTLERVSAFTPIMYV